MPLVRLETFYWTRDWTKLMKKYVFTLSIKTYEIRKPLANCTFFESIEAYKRIPYHSFVYFRKNT